MQNPQTNFDKKLLELDRERRALRPFQWNTLPLDEPIQRGWIRRHVLSPKIGNHRDLATLADILSLISTRLHHRTADFCRRRKVAGHRRLVEIEQPLRNIPAWQWERLRLPEIWKFYFRIEQVRHFKTWYPEYVFAHPDLFELQIEPLWVTELQVLNPAVDSRIAEIGRWLKNRHAEPRLDWLLGHSRRYWRCEDDRPRKEQRLTAKRIAQAYADFPEIEPNPFTQWLPLNRWEIAA